jgi:hypothetical protein
MKTHLIASNSVHKFSQLAYFITAWATKHHFLLRGRNYVSAAGMKNVFSFLLPVALSIFPLFLSYIYSFHFPSCLFYLLLFLYCFLQVFHNTEMDTGTSKLRQPSPLYCYQHKFFRIILSSEPQVCSLTRRRIHNPWS